MSERLNQCRQLIQEHEVIRRNISHISKSVSEFVNLADLKDIASDFTPRQISFLNYRRIKLRRHLIDLLDGLQTHHRLEEEMLRWATSLWLWQNIQIQQTRIFKTIADIEAIILNLSPLGILFNSNYLKSKVEDTCQTLSELICQEDSFLEVSEINCQFEFSLT
jgi:hypothetical protein